MKLEPIVSKNIRMRVRDGLKIGLGSIIDDFCYFSTQLEIGKFCHIANGVSIAGGRSFQFQLGDYSSISSGVKIWCTSDDFVRDMACLTPPELEYPRNSITGNVTIGSMTIVGSNSVIMPDQKIPDGVAIGALSFVPADFEFEPWYVYAGVPVRKLKARDKREVLHQRAILEQKYRDYLIVEGASENSDSK
jgi:acetyltransferase-like isoleucine patch superfamily enzyme